MVYINIVENPTWLLLEAAEVLDFLREKRFLKCFHYHCYFYTRSNKWIFKCDRHPCVLKGILELQEFSVINSSV